jgi:hypothetical protein
VLAASITGWGGQSLVQEAFRHQRRLGAERVLYRADGRPMTARTCCGIRSVRTWRRANGSSRSIHELAGPRDLATTQRYMHLSTRWAPTTTRAARAPTRARARPLLQAGLVYGTKHRNRLHRPRNQSADQPISRVTVGRLGMNGEPQRNRTGGGRCAPPSDYSPSSLVRSNESSRLHSAVGIHPRTYF